MHRAAETQPTAHPAGNGRGDVSAAREAHGSERSTACPHGSKPPIQAGRRPDQPRAAGKPVPLCLSNWPERWDPHTQSKEMSSRKAGRTRHSSPCPGPEDGGSAWNLLGGTSTPPRTIRPFGRRPHPSPVWGRPLPPALRTPILWVTPAEVQTGRLQVGGVCMWVMLFGWKQRPFWRDEGWSGAGRGVRYSQPRAKPADGRAPCGNPSKDDRGVSRGEQTIGTNSLDQRHILNRFLLSAGHMARLQPGGLPAVCCEVRVGSTGWPPAAPSLSYGLLAGLLLRVRRVPPETG